MTGRFVPGPSELKRLLPDAGWTLANNILSVVGGLAVVKLIAMLVAAEETGVANLAIGIVSLLTLFVVQPVITAQQRFFFDHALQGDPRSFARIIEPLVLRCALIMAAGYALVALVYRAFGETAYTRLAIPALALCLLTPHIAAEMSLIEARREYRRLAIAQTLLKLAPAPFLALLLLSPLAPSQAIISAQALALLLVFLAFGGLLRAGRVVGAGPRGTQAEDAGTSTAALSGVSAFGWSLYGYNVAFWVLSSSDRYVIAFFRSHAEVGLYTLNYGFCALPYLMLGSWIENFTRSRLYARSAAEDREGIRAVMRGRLLLAIAGSLGGTCIMLFLARPIGLMLLGTTYWHSLTLVMVLCAGYSLHVLANIATGLLVALKRGRLLAWVYIAAACVNVALSIVLVPSYGIMGAAIATLVGFAVTFVLLTTASLRILRGPTSGPIQPLP